MQNCTVVAAAAATTTTTTTSAQVYTLRWANCLRCYLLVEEEDDWLDTKNYNAYLALVIVTTTKPDSAYMNV